MLNRVHRKPGPGSGIDIAMVQFVRHSVKRGNMQKPMGEIEANFVNERHQKEQRDKSNRMVGDS